MAPFRQLASRRFLLSLLLFLPCIHSLSAAPTLKALSVEDPIRLDGILDETIWGQAETAAGFIQSEPRQGEPASEATEVRVLFDSDHLYFGVRCFDGDPGSIVANSLRRDFDPEDEDHFAILLDPFSSSRDGFLFITNPGGAKRDEQVSNEGRESNVNWDAAWQVRTHQDARGWSAEIRIPFQSIRYDRVRRGAWNVNFGRQIRRRNEVVHWAEIPRQFDIRQVGLAGRLLGLDQQSTEGSRNLLVTPYTALNITDPGNDGSATVDVGGDVKFGLTPGLTLDLTFNTDFSHVEVDQQQVNLDRFRLSFPEKRDFFLENQGIFEIGSVRLQRSNPDAEDPTVFYSRSIGLSLDGAPVPILGGARLTGRLNRYSLGLMTIQTDEGADQARENATVLRVKRDLFSRSSVGGFFLSRTGPERPGNRVYGADGLFRPSNDLTFNAYLAQSATPGLEGEDWVLRGEGLYDSRWLRLGGTHANVQENYQNDLGFVVRKGVLAERLEVRPRLRLWEGRILREIQPVLNVRYVSSVEHQLLSREQSLGIDFSFQNGSFLRFRRRNYFERLEEDFEIRRGILLPVEDYHFNEQGIEFTSDRSRRLSGRITWYDGGFWNGDKTSWTLNGQFRPTAHLNAEVDFSRDDVTLPGGDFTANLLRIRLQYAFNTRAFLDAFFQYNSERDSLTSNLRFNWIHHPLSDLFLVYTEQRPTDGQGETDRIVSLKYTHLLSF